MHPTPIFTNDDRGQALSFAASYPFATLAVNGEAGPVTALVPLVYDAKREHFIGHVAKANSFWKAAQKSGQAVAVFRGPDAYISPSFYPSKAEHGKTVPTWNYMAVEIRGELTDKMESHRDVPWAMSDAPEDYIAKLSAAIVGFSLRIDDITFVEKLSQNKTERDRAGVIHALENSKLSTDVAVASVMKAR